MALRPLILILEDEAIIAMDIERNLLDAGAAEIVCLSSCAAALRWLEHQTPDVAVIDIFLHDGECIEAAEVLTERRVPFVVHSARRRVSSAHHFIFLNGSWVPKPSHPLKLVEAVTAHLPSLGVGDNHALEQTGSQLEGRSQK